MTLSVTYSCRAALARTPACPGPPRGPPPLCPPTPARGAPRTLRARPAPARTKLEPAVTRAPRGLHARLDSGPAGSATGDWPAPALPASYLPRLGRHPGEGALPASRRTPGSPGPSARRGALARAGVNPFAAASRRPAFRRLSTPRPSLPVPSPQSRPPAVRWGTAQPPPSSRGGRWGGLPGDWKLGRATSPPRGPAEHRGVNPRAKGPPHLPPLTPSGPSAYLPESRRWRRVSIPWWSVGAGRRSAPEARAAGGRAASTPGRGPGRDWALLSGLDFSASTRILPRLSRPIRCCSATT